MRRLRIALAVVAALLASCSENAVEDTTTSSVPQLMPVTVHEWNARTEAVGDPWIGLIWRPEANGEVVFLAEALIARHIPAGTPMGLYVEDVAMVSPDRSLHSVTDAASPEDLPRIEMIWSSGVGVDGTYELDAALERTAEAGTSFYLFCAALTDNGPAVAVVNDALVPLESWAVVDGISFETLPPDQVECG